MPVYGGQQDVLTRAEAAEKIHCGKAILHQSSVSDVDEIQYDENAFKKSSFWT